MDPNMRREKDNKIQRIVRLFLTVILSHAMGNTISKMQSAKKKIPESKAKKNVFMIKVGSNFYFPLFSGQDSEPTLTVLPEN